MPPPDVLLLNGAGGPLLYAFGLQAKPRALPPGRHEPLPTPAPLPARAPPILLILGESIRRDAVCPERAPGCTLSPRLDEAAPDRIGYARAFSTASCTELASPAIWTGLPVNAGTDALARAPLVWDWAKARGYRTGYFTSQNLLFQQSDQFLHGSRIDLLREARDRVVDAPIDDGSPDELTTGEALAFVEAEGAPAFVVVHHANTHAPYRQGPGFTRFPTDDGLGRYRNSLAQNDAIVGDLVKRLREGPRGARAIVMYVSDHGEAWGEHGSYFHSFDLYAEQIDVPLWIDAPPGALPLDRPPSRREDTARRDLRRHGDPDRPVRRPRRAGPPRSRRRARRHEPPQGPARRARRAALELPPHARVRRRRVRRDRVPAQAALRRPRPPLRLPRPRGRSRRALAAPARPLRGAAAPARSCVRRPVARYGLALPWPTGSGHRNVTPFRSILFSGVSWKRGM